MSITAPPSLTDTASEAAPAARTWSDPAICRFLNRATFGATTASLAEFKDVGSASAWLDDQFNKPSGQRHADRVQQQYEASAALPKPCFGPATNERIVHEAWGSFVQAPDQLRKRVAAALLEIFVINERVGFIGIQNNQVTAASYLDMLEENAFGNFRQLLEGVALHPAMGHFLSHIGNRKASYGADGIETRVPDENFARELLQLFSIGLYELNTDGSLRLDAAGRPIETYDQGDIFNLARVFTGWNHAQVTGFPRHRLPMVPDATQHSPERKHFLSAQIAAGTGPVDSLRQALDAVFQHPNVGPFIGRQIIQRLVCSNPSPAYVARVAAAFNRSPAGVRGDMKTLIRAVLTDPEALRPASQGVDTTRWGKAREPMMRLIAVARALGARSDQALFPIGDLSDASSGLGQSPFLSPSVFNFFRPGYVPPSSDLAQAGLVAPELQICTGSQIIGSINTVNRFIETGQSALRFTAWSEWRARAADPQALLAHAELLFNGRAPGFSGALPARMLAVLAAIPSNQPDRRVKTALQLVISSPTFLVQY